MDALGVVGKFKHAKKIMDECENSQLVLERRKQHIKMAPKFLGNFRAGIQQHLTENLLHWDKVSDGFPMAYTNVHALQRVGKIISDHSCVHFDVEADYIIFKPVVGQKLIGKVNKIAKRHIGCLVHDHFNAWALHTSSTEKMASDSLIGADIEITILDLSTSRNVVSIKGKIERLLSPELEKGDSININAIPSKRRQRKKKNVMEDAEDIEKEVNDIVMSKKKKKHKKETEISDNVPSETHEENDSHLTESQATVNGELEEDTANKSKKKHKKEKKKKKNREDDSLDVDVDVTNDMDNSIASISFSEPLFSSTQIDDVNNNSGKKKSKKHKKRHEISNDIMNSAAEVALIENDSPHIAADSSGKGEVINSAGNGVHKHKKAKKRKHSDTGVATLEDSVVNQDLELSEPSRVKKLKTQMKGLEVDHNSSADFEDTSSIRKKEKKRKKHKEH